MSGGSHLLCVPLKRTADIDVSRPVENFVKSRFAAGPKMASSSPPKEFAGKMKEFQKLRQAAIKNERGEAAANAIANYYDQLASLEQKVPAGDLQIAFKWRDAFDKGGLFGSKLSLTGQTIKYEKVCVLFNLAAINTIVASEQNLDSTEGLQKALKRFQLAAGIFNHLKEIVVAHLNVNPTSDLEPETLGVLGELMLAQAQEMVVKKALADKMKVAIVAKLSAQCEDLFANVMKSMQRENVRNIWDSSWLPNVCGKQAIYNGLAHFHQAKVCQEQKVIGEQIARLDHAKTLFQAGLDRGGNGELVQCKEWLRKSDVLLAEAKKDNDFIYHERIPEAKTLTSIAKAVVAKPTSPLPDRLGTETIDLFDDLCPAAVHNALTVHATAHQARQSREITKVKDATNALNEALCQMNLPAAIEDVKGDSVPGSLVSKANSVREAGGIDAIKKLADELPELLTRNTEILNECERLLKEEKDSDNQLREQFKDKWTRTPSNQLTSSFDTNASKYRGIINNATQADSVIKEKFTTHNEGFVILSKGGDALAHEIPKTGAQAVQGGATVAKLKALMEDVETIKAERDAIMAELNDASCDMKSVFFNEHKSQSVIDSHNISEEYVEKTFKPLTEMVQDSMNRQESLLRSIRENHSTFVKENGAGGLSNNARDEKLKSLAAAHDAFFELRGNLNEGTKFYNDLTNLLVTFQTKVSDFCYARKTEKDELMKDLTSKMASASLTEVAHPSPPSHHQAPVGNADKKSDNPPPRPPQPASNPYAGAPPAAAAPNPYAGAPAGYVPPPYPYPQQAYTPMPAGYNPYAPPQYPPGPYPQYPGGYPPQQPGYPPQGYPPYPPPPQ